MSSHPTDHVEEAMREPRRIPAWLVLPGILAVVLVAILAGRLLRPPLGEDDARGPLVSGADWTPSPPPQGEVISLTVDFGNGAQKRLAALPWRNGLTVLDALQEAEKFRPGITFAFQGAGETVFVTAIDGLKNAGAHGGNWVYEVNGEKATRSAGIQALSPGDALLWRYAPPE
jgi:hypothetical protein